MAHPSTLFAGIRMSRITSFESLPGRFEFLPGPTWEELKLAIVDILRPANSVEEYAIKLATFKSEKGEAVSASASVFIASNSSETHKPVAYIT